MIITGFIGLAFEGISSCLHNKRYKALHKAVKAMSIQTDIWRNKLKHLENTFLMYGIDNTETLEKLFHVLHSKQSSYESLFASKTSAAYEFYSQMHGAQDIQHYVINSVLHFRTTTG